MAIDPPSDIVLDVARAADPERSAAVARRLTNLAAGAGDVETDFASALGQAGRPSPGGSPATGAPNMRARLANVAEATNDKAGRARVQFEAVLLNSFIGEMLPKDAPEVYGQGLAGQMWRSMLADQVSRQIAGSGALGIAQRLFATHPLSASSSLMRAAGSNRTGVAETAEMSGNALSVPSGADLIDGAELFPGPKPI